MTQQQAAGYFALAGAVGMFLAAIVLSFREWKEERRRGPRRPRHGQ